MLKRGMKPVHPGVLIRENIEGLRSEGKDVTIEDVANALGITRKTLSNVMNGHQGISPAMAIPLVVSGSAASDALLKNVYGCGLSG